MPARLVLTGLLLAVPPFSLGDSELERKLGAPSGLLEATAQIAKARTLHDSGDAQAALIAWERVIDRCEASPAELAQALAGVQAARPAVPPINDSIERARSWKTLVVVFEELDFTWRDEEGQQHSVEQRMSKADVGAIEGSIRAFREHVFRSTSGILRIDPTIERVSTPLRQLSGSAKDGFWLAPGDASKVFERSMRGVAYESVFAYVKMSDGHDRRVPAAFWGGTYGGDFGPAGAGYTNICWSPGVGSPDGEVEFHEWLHQIDWMFGHVLMYPDALVPNPDTGREEGQEGGDLDFRRAHGEQGWMRFYRHIAEEHITRLMWSEAGMRSEARSPLKPNDIAHWIVLGPFRAPKAPMFQDFVGEAKLRPRPGASAGGKKWCEIALEGRVVNLLSVLDSGGNPVAYLATRVRSPTARSAVLSLGSDDGVRAWVNTELVHSNDVDRRLTPDEDRISIELREGWNDLLFKVRDKGGGWGLQARLLDEDGRAMRDVEDALP